jgi:peptidoglycan/xylan/chitin deacetylase (PgdA/CDA1 family)
MILFLTYHKIGPGDDAGDPDFYTVSRSRFLRHLEALAAGGLRCVEASALLDGKISASDYILSFDDGTSDHYEIVFPLLRERGCRAVFFIPAGKINRPGHLTDAQVRELAAAGHTIGLHGLENKRFDTLSDDEMRRRMSLSRNILHNLTGAQPWIFAPPGGFINAHVREVAQGFGARAIRTMRWGYNEKVDLTALETIPLNRYTDDQFCSKLNPTRRPPFVYFGKQATKALMPAHTYERLRSLLFKIGRRRR